MHGQIPTILLLFFGRFVWFHDSVFLTGEKMYEELFLQVADAAGWLLSEPMFGP